MKALRVVAAVALTISVALLIVLGLGPRTGRYRTLTVLSGSMAPSMPAGSVVFVTPIAASRVRPGDVIAFQAPTPDRSVVTHRVVSVDRDGDRPVVVTKGDANDVVDPWRARIEDDLVWRVRLAVPHLGRGINALRAPWAHRVLVLALPFVLAIVWLRDVWRPVEPSPGVIRLMPSRGRRARDASAA
jgi:signal peptidase